MSFSIPSLQRRDILQSRLSPRQVPVFHQFGTVEGRPLDHQSQYSWRQMTLQKGQRFDRDQRSLTRVANMKVWRRMVMVEHPDYDTEEPADLGHARLPF